MDLDEYRGNGWFTERAKLYQEMAEHPIDKLDEVQVVFRKKEYGWLYTDVYVNGELKHSIDISLIFNPIVHMSNWLSDIVDDRKLSTILEIDEEGLSSTFCYEHIVRAQSGVWRKEILSKSINGDQLWIDPLWVDGLRSLLKNDGDSCPYDTDICFGYGLFYIYDSGRDKIVAKAVVKTKDFVNSIYMSFLDFAGAIKIDKTHKNTKRDKWDFYNEMKSSMVEWNMNAKSDFRSVRVKFRKEVRIVDMVMMEPDYGDGLFWSCGGCCGNADYVWANDIKYDLSSIKGLREWYDDYDENGLNWKEKKYKEFHEKGKIFAEKVRELLPDNIDLCYSRQKVRYAIGDVLAPPLLVSNKRMWKYPSKDDYLCEKFRGSEQDNIEYSAFEHRRVGECGLDSENGADKVCQCIDRLAYQYYVLSRQGPFR